MIEGSLYGIYGVRLILSWFEVRGRDDDEDQYASQAGFVLDAPEYLPAGALCRGAWGDLPRQQLVSREELQ